MPTANPAALGSPRFILEENQRLSCSMLWRIQRGFYETNGIGAWNGGALPFYVTSNPFIANAYARVAFAFLTDCLTPVSPQPAFQIVEIGSGSGRFAFHLLTKLTQLANEFSPAGTPVRFRYIMTDLAQSNVDFWRDHLALRPFVKSGALDFAVFDATAPQPLELQCSGEVLTPGASAFPLVAIANYVLDSVPQDAFHISSGRLFESRISVTSSQEEPDPLDPAILGRIRVEYRNLPATPDYYADPEFDAVLGYYCDKLPASDISFPIAALQSIRYLSALSDGRMLLMCADKGHTREESLLGTGSSGLVVHGGAFSLTVNLNAIGQYFRNRGGKELYTSQRSNSLAVCAFLEGRSPGEYRSTEREFQHVMEECSPTDLFHVAALASHCEEASEVLALVRLSGWDHEVFMAGFGALMEPKTAIGADLRHELLRAVRQVWRHYYGIGEPRDLAFHLGVLLSQLDYSQEALCFLDRSASQFGLEPGTAYNISLCHYRLGQLASALEFANRALELDPDFDQAKALRLTLEAEMA